jgi:hypothetical protein
MDQCLECSLHMLFSAVEYWCSPLLDSNSERAGRRKEKINFDSEPVKKYLSENNCTTTRTYVVTETSNEFTIVDFPLIPKFCREGKFNSDVRSICI